MADTISKARRARSWDHVQRFIKKMPALVTRLGRIYKCRRRLFEIQWLLKAS
ncbi:hypothetical protein M433DRAFT_551119 [Acidomyces richmondensis BFW]|nr:hypothetical protein M433DRAFT_551119 [Acidomyces richmondensis BFW]